jgi:5-methylcytosine-specific restriction endonuclease McrA
MSERRAAPSADAVPVLVERPLTAELSRLDITVSRQLLRKLEAARDALSHSHPGADAAAVLEVGLDLILDRQAKRRGLVKNPRHKATATSTAPGSRYIPASVRRAVWERDGERCAFPIDGGGACGSTYQPEIDHVIPVAKGGKSTVVNCRVACRVHNLRAAREALGDAVMDRYTTPKGGGCSEPPAVYRGSSATYTPCRFGCTTT